MGTEQSTEVRFQAEGLSYASSPDDDFRTLRPAYLDKFIAEQLQPDEDFRRLVYTALDSLCRYFQRYMRPPTVKRLIKGGSMGKGTALKGRSDLDCILVMNGVGDALELEDKIGGILSQLGSLLDSNPLRDQGWGIRVIRRDNYLVQIEMYNFQWHETVDVDILPTFDADVYNEYSRNQLYDSMARYGFYPRALCSAALAELQRDFIKQRPAKLKNLIRLVKHWCKEYLPCERGQPRVPNSYLLELLTIYVWEKAGSPHGFTTAQLFNSVMEAMYYHSQLNVKWGKYYNLSWIQSGKPPQIMDPANPYNNVYRMVKDWGRVKRVIKETVQMPLLQNYSTSLVDTEDEEGGSASYCIIS